MFNCVRSSILTNSVEIFADMHICFVADNFYFLIFGKHNSKISFRDVSLSGHFFPFRDCPEQSGTFGHPTLEFT